MHSHVVLLDLDGTLVDSEALIVEHLGAALTSAGGPTLTPAELRAYVGPDLRDVFFELGLHPEASLAALAAFRASYYLVADQSPVFPGVSATLDRLVAVGVTLAVATAKPEPVAAKVAASAGLADRLALVAGADHENGRSTKAEVIASALVRLGVDPDPAAVVMVGDRLHDVEGAAAHGLDTIGVSWGCAAPGELDAAGAVAVVDSAEELASEVLRRRATPYELG